MKPTRILLNTISILGLTILIAGCASNSVSNTQSKQNMLIAAGFKVITPKTAAQKQKLQQLPAGKIAMIKKGSKTYYVMPDAANNQAYVGGPTEYQAYQQARAANKLANEEIATDQMYQDDMMEWGAWGGWGAGWGPMGMGGAGFRR